MTFADTSYFLALLNADDTWHAVARKASAALADNILSTWKPWHEVVTLRPDLASGELSLQQFAAEKESEHRFCPAFVTIAPGLHT